MIDRKDPTLDKKKKKGKRVSAGAPPVEKARPGAPLQRPPAKAQPTPRTPQPAAKARPAPPSPPARRPAAPSPAVPQTGWTLSLEAALYLLAALIAFAARLYALGRFPLQEIEGARAWAAWSYLRGLPEASLAGQPPLVVFGDVLSFMLFGAGDVAARLLPALAGGVCALLPYALRKEIGRSGALVASFVLALSPTVMLVSRSVDGGAVVAAAALALVAIGLACRREVTPRLLYLAAIVLGIMFAADKTAGPTALILGAYALVAWLRAGRQPEIPVQALRIAVLVFIATTVILGTGFLADLRGVQAALVDPLTQWLSSSSGPIGERAGFYARILLAYEPLVLVFAVLGALAYLFNAVRHSGLALNLRPVRVSDLAAEDEAADTEQTNDTSAAMLEPGRTDDSPLLPFLVYWSLAAFVFYMLLGDQSVAVVAQVVVPITLLAATFIGRVFESSLPNDRKGDMLVLTGIVILIAFSLVAWGNPTSIFGGRFASLEKRLQNVQALLLAVVILGVVAIGAWYAYRLRARAALVSVALALLAVLGVYMVHSAWQLNHVNWPDATEPILLQRTAPDIIMLRDDLREVSRRQGDDDMAVTLDDRIGQPAVWYLRQFTNVTVARVGAGVKTPAVIVPADAKDVVARSLGSAYVNQRYRLRSTWVPAAPLDRWLRWAHVRDAVTTVTPENIVAFYKLTQ